MDTGHSAITKKVNGVHMTHVYLGGKLAKVFPTPKESIPEETRSLLWTVGCDDKPRDVVKVAAPRCTNRQKLETLFLG